MRNDTYKEAYSWDDFDLDTVAFLYAKNKFR